MKNRSKHCNARFLLCQVVFSMAFMVATNCFAQQAIAVKSLKKTDHGVVLHMHKGMMRVAVITPSIIHVSYTPGARFDTYPKLAVVKKQRPAVKWHVQRSGGSVHVVTARLNVDISRTTGAVTYRDTDGHVILVEPRNGGKAMVPATVQGEHTYHATQDFAFTPDEALYGLGQYQKSSYMDKVLMNYARHSIHDVQMLNTNKNAVVPFLVSSKGYGILWNNSSGSWFHDSFVKGFWSNVAHQIDYYFVYGPKIKRVVAGYRDLTGTAPLFPKWAYGYIQSRDRYTSQKQVVGVVKTYRKKQIPLDAIVQDWRYWGNGGLTGKRWQSEWGNTSVWNALDFNNKRYPDPEQMMQTLHHTYHAHLFISVWPSLGVDTPAFKAMKKRGYLFPKAPWPPNSGVRIYDAFNPAAQKLYWTFMNNGLFSTGVDGWWLDSTEPSGYPTYYVNEGAKVHFNGHTYAFARYLNAYSLMSTAGVYKNQRKSTSKKRVFMLTRSAFAGQQRNAAATWSGDTNASWHTLQRQIAAGLNFTLAGIPYWTTDIGGYLVGRSIFPGGAKNKAYRKLFVRWFEYGAFCPLFRVHGAYIPRSVWYFGKPGSWSYDALVQTDKLRYRLMPYIYSQAWQVTHDNSSIMRGLVYDFQHDPKVYNIWDEYMFGPSLLINPVTEPDVSSRDVYLPKGTRWTSFWSGNSFDGGQTISAPTPIDHIPVYVRAGSIVPMGPVRQYAEQAPNAPVVLRVYPGADGHFTLYDDAGDGYGYEKGAYSTIRLDWDNAAQRLILEKRHGSYPGMSKSRTFRVVLVTKHHGVGLSSTVHPDRTVTYDGTKKVVKFSAQTPS